MSVKLRLTRMGRKKLPYYRIVAIDSRKRRDGEYLDKIGHYNPVSDPVEIVIDKEKAISWLEKGAIPSDTVKSFMSRKGILLEWDLKKQGLDADAIEKELAKWRQQQEDRTKRKEAMVAMKQREVENEAAKKEAEEKAQAEADAAAAAAEAAAEEAPAEEPEADAESEDKVEE